MILVVLLLMMMLKIKMYLLRIIYQDVVSDEDDEEDDYNITRKTTKLKKKSELVDREEDRDLILDTMGIRRPTKITEEDEEEEDRGNYRVYLKLCQSNYADEDNSEDEPAYAVQTSEESDELAICRRIFGDDIVAFINGSLTISKPPVIRNRVADVKQQQQDPRETIIIQQDIPERMLMLMEKRENKNFDEKMGIDFLKIEADWIYDKIESSLVDRRDADFNISKEEDVQQITQFLNFYVVYI